jgi:hypothetical protein
VNIDVLADEATDRGQSDYHDRSERAAPINPGNDPADTLWFRSEVPPYARRSGNRPTRRAVIPPHPVDIT